MTKLEDAITLAAREMSREARVELCHLLMHDLDDAEQRAIDDAWPAEIQRRINARDRGEGSSRPSDEVVSTLREKRPA